LIIEKVWCVRRIVWLWYINQVCYLDYQSLLMRTY
jgi:hypothetical protein